MNSSIVASQEKETKKSSLRALAIPSSTFDKNKKKKNRCDIAFVNQSIPRAVFTSHWHATRVMGDMLFWADWDEAKRFAKYSAPYTLTKSISSFEKDLKTNRLNVFFHPFSDFNVSSMLEDLWESPDKGVLEALKMVKELEDLASQVGDLPKWLPETETESSWADLFRLGEAPPFEMKKKEDSVYSVVWQLLEHNGHWDMILSALSLTFQLTEELGYTVDEMGTYLQNRGVPQTMGDTWAQLDHLTKFLMMVKDVIINRRSTFQHKCDFFLTMKGGHLKPVSTIVDGGLMNIKGQIFMINKLTFLPPVKPTLMDAHKWENTDMDLIPHLQKKPPNPNNEGIFAYLFEERKKQKSDAETTAST